MGEEVVPEIELDAPRDADDRHAHRVAEGAGTERDAEQHERVAPELRGSHPAIEVVHRNAQHLGLGERDEVGDDDRQHTPDEPAPIPGEIGDESVAQRSRRHLRAEAPVQGLLVFPRNPWNRLRCVSLTEMPA